MNPISCARDREPLPFARVLRAYLTEAKFETLAALRTTGFALPFLIVPVAIYGLFGVVIGDGPGGAEFADYIFAGFGVLAAAMPGIFTGVILATEREGNLLQLKRALPLPPGATIVAKVLMAMGVAAVAITLVAGAALLGGKIQLSFAQVAIVWATLIAGTIPFCAIGLLLGARVSASAAPAWGIFSSCRWSFSPASSCRCRRGSSAGCSSGRPSTSTSWRSGSPESRSSPTFRRRWRRRRSPG